jgi:hypothetical protein
MICHSICLRMLNLNSFIFIYSILSPILPPMIINIIRPLELLYSSLFPIKKKDYHNYPHLVNVDNRLLILRFEILKQLNILFRSNFNFIHLNGMIIQYYSYIKNVINVLRKLSYC